MLSEGGIVQDIFPKEKVKVLSEKEMVQDTFPEKVKVLSERGMVQDIFP